MVGEKVWYRIWDASRKTQEWIGRRMSSESGREREKGDGPTHSRELALHIWCFAEQASPTVRVHLAYIWVHKELSPEPKFDGMVLIQHRSQVSRAAFPNVGGNQAQPSK